MNFTESNAIYLQIASHMMDRILSGEWPEDQRIPSVRDLATEVGVNPNTAMRAYMLLESKDIIYSRRGVGYSASVNASSIIMEMRKQEFLESDLPKLFNSMRILSIDIQEIEKRYQKFHNKTNLGEGAGNEA